jgi:hypothetical protein
MAGIVHLRIVIAVFLVGGIAALMPYDWPAGWPPHAVKPSFAASRRCSSSPRLSYDALTASSCGRSHCSNSVFDFSGLGDPGLDENIEGFQQLFRDAWENVRRH